MDKHKFSKTEKERYREFNNHKAITRTLLEIFKKDKYIEQYIKIIILLSITTLIFAFSIIIILISLLLK